MRTRNALAMFALGLAACSGGGGGAPVAGPVPVVASSGSGSAVPSTPAPRSTAPGVKVTFADVGLEASSLDRTSDPCIDFYQFACGGWLVSNQIPADRPRWGRGGELDEKNKVVIKNLLDEAAKGIGVDATTKKLGDYYASCMDEAAIERAGTKAIAPLLGRLRGVSDAGTWLAAVSELHKLGEWVVWSNQVTADLKDSTTNVTYLDSAGLGLPDRDYYVKPDFKDKLDAYKLHVAKLLAIAGMPAAKADAAAIDVLAIETEIAKATKTATEQRDIPGLYNPTDEKTLAKQVRLDWRAYWRGIGALPSKKIIVASPKFFAGLDKLRAKFKWQQWASYFAFHFVARAAFTLPKVFDDETFELRKTLTGVEKQRERTHRCIDATQGALGELLGQQYVAKTFPATSKQAAATLVDAMVKVLDDEIGKLEWMSDATKLTARGKLGRLVRMVGYPDKFRAYDYEVRRDDFAGNALRASAFENRRQLAKAGKPVDRTEWGMDTYTVDAYYDTGNTTVLPAGILQPPFFGQDRSIAVNLGGIGMVIGHELTHGFDDQGSQFDGDGNLKNWWQKDDEKKFAERTQCVAEQYSTFEALPKQFINGKLTLGENIADIGGVKTAFKAYRSLRRDAAKVYVADGFDEDQQFFIAVGQAWCGKTRPAEAQRLLTMDPHSPAKFRVYGALRNLKEFADAFKCAAGTPMRPANSCSVW
ncbi:MAG: M13 family metallopeptidase [Kofleriaceae bacterium]